MEPSDECTFTHTHAHTHTPPIAKEKRKNYVCNQHAHDESGGDMHARLEGSTRTHFFAIESD